MMNPTRFLLSLFILVKVTACTVQSEITPTSVHREWDQKELKQIVEEWRIDSDVPGAVVGISLPGQAELLLESGESDMGNNVALEPDDRFRIASLTKTFLAAEVLKLASQGKIGLDDPLDEYLPGTPYGDVATIRHLLGHRSGYFDPVHDDPGFIPHLAENLGRLWTREEMLALSFDHDLHFQPGSDYRYGNTNYILLGKIIEQAAGKTLGEALTSDLFVPLGLEHTFYATPETDADPDDLAHGYAVHPLTGQLVDTTTIPYETILSVSVDTMISNAGDLLKWSRALYGKDSLVIDPSFQKEMLTFDSISPYGLGVFQFDTPLGKSVGHGGDTAGYLSRMEYIPGQDLSIVILANTDDPSVNLAQLRDLLLIAMYGDSTEDRLEEWIAGLKSEDPDTRKNAIRALGHSGPGNERVVSNLIEILQSDPVAENRKEAALALGLAGSDSERARQALKNALQDGDAAVRKAAELALQVMK